MRIISGKYRGLKLTTPKGDSTRPTSDRTKESIFNILRNYIDFKDKEILDICAGSGALGLEVLSRGAKKATFIDKNEEAKKCISKNSEKMKESVEIILSDAERVLKRLIVENKKFDLIFFDPPYKLEFLYLKVLDLVPNLLAIDAVFVLESAKEFITPDFLGSYKKLDSRIYGSTKIDFYMEEK